MEQQTLLCAIKICAKHTKTHTHTHFFSIANKLNAETVEHQLKKDSRAKEAYDN
jgi:hypothetical protein